MSSRGCTLLLIVCRRLCTALMTRRLSNSRALCRYNAPQDETTWKRSVYATSPDGKTWSTPAVLFTNFSLDGTQDGEENGPWYAQYLGRVVLVFSPPPPLSLSRARCVFYFLMTVYFLINNDVLIFLMPSCYALKDHPGCQLNAPRQALHPKRYAGCRPSH